MKTVLTNAGVTVAALSLMALTPALAIDSPAASQNTLGAGALATTPTAVTVDRQGCSLSDAQLDAFRNLKDKYAVDNATQKATVQVLRHQLFAELSKPTVDRGAVLSIQGKINAASDEIGNNRANFLVDASGILTAEQRTEMHHRMLHHRFGFQRHAGFRQEAHGGAGSCAR